MSVGVQIIRPNLKPLTFEGVTNSRSAGKKVAYPAAIRKGLINRSDYVVQQCTLRANILDHNP